MDFIPGDGGDALNEIEDALRLAAFLDQDRVDDLRRLGFGKAAPAQDSLRSSSVRATIFSRAALMPLIKRIGDELAKRVSAGAASWAKREAAYFECRMVISSKSSTPQRLRFWQTARR
jgi:hypothetical protein